MSLLASTLPQKKKNIILLDPDRVGIRGNEKADAAAKAGLLRRVTNVRIPFDVFEKYINVLLKCKCQSEWEDINNKLHEIHPRLGLWPSFF